MDDFGGVWLRLTIVKIDPQMAQRVEAAVAFVNFADGDTTPSLKPGGVMKFSFKTQNSAPAIITMLNDGTYGQEVCIVMGDGNTRWISPGAISRATAGSTGPPPRAIT